MIDPDGEARSHGRVDEKEEPRVALTVSGLSKAYPGTVALDGARLVVRAGEVHALVGQNGSGKSTLIKILAGVESADRGRLAINGLGEQDIGRHSPTQAHRAGLRFVHQQTDLLAGLSVAENIAVVQGYPQRLGIVRWPQVREIAAGAFASLNLKGIDPDAPVHTLRPAERTMVAVARAVSDRAERAVLVLDEPTASLPREDVSVLFDALRRIRDSGHAIVFVTHRLPEVFEIADRVTVLRDGATVSTSPIAQIDHDTLVAAIVGRALERSAPRAVADVNADVLLDVRDLRAGAFGPASFALARGEIVGLAGLTGSGRSSLLRTLFGDLERTAGEVLLDGEPVAPGSTRAARDLGFAYLAEDRASHGLFPQDSITDNLVAARWRTRLFGTVLRGTEHRVEAGELTETLDVRAPSLAAAVASLSGGNQQKCMMGRWLRIAPRVLLLDEPTQGVDIGARRDIYRLMREAASTGSAALVASSDLEELTLIANRVLVLSEGSITADVSGSELTESRLAELCVAHRPAA